jgi:hypothetical protein
MNRLAWSVRHPRRACACSPGLPRTAGRPAGLVRRLGRRADPGLRASPAHTRYLAVRGLARARHRRRQAGPAVPRGRIPQHPRRAVPAGQRHDRVPGRDCGSPDRHVLDHGRRACRSVLSATFLACAGGHLPDGGRARRGAGTAGAQGEGPPEVVADARMLSAGNSPDRLTRSASAKTDDPPCHDLNSTAAGNNGVCCLIRSASDLIADYFR